MDTMFRWLTIVAIFIGINGCASSGTGAQFTGAITTTPNKARVVIFRESAIYASGLKYTVFANLKPVGELGNGGYIDFYSESETISFKAVRDLHFGLLIAYLSREHEKNIELMRLVAESGRVYYIEFRYSSGEVLMKQIPELEAVERMGGLRKFVTPNS